MSGSDIEEQDADYRFIIEVKMPQHEKPVKFEAKGSMTVTRLAQKIAYEDGIAVEDQQLYFGDELIFDGGWSGFDLKRSRILAPFGIVENSTIVQKTEKSPPNSSAEGSPAPAE